jgi:hypothetical protein
MVMVGFIGDELAHPERKATDVSLRRQHLLMDRFQTPSAYSFMQWCAPKWLHRKQQNTMQMHLATHHSSP